MARKLSTRVIDNGRVDTAEVIRRYRRFADVEAPGRSESYARWAAAVADDADLAAVIARFPDQRTQPPLVFAVARLLGCDATDGAGFREFVSSHVDALDAELSRRSLQTNEPLRCAALLPALSLIDGPIALIELGASGGLCLYPDRYAYRYTRGAQEFVIAPAGGAELTLLSDLRGDGMPPLSVPDVVWRAGVDLDPLDMTVSTDAAWLKSLVWTGETGREERIAAAVEVVAADPPIMIAGDAADGLDRALDLTPRDATVVVTTPGVLPFLPRARREDLIARVGAADVRWITLDAPGLHDAWIDDRPLPDDGFVLALDGHVLGSADPLGAWVRWDPSAGVGGPA